MPLKVRELKASLRKAGFYMRPGKGSHTVWEHPIYPTIRVTVSGKDGNDAEPYQIAQVQKAFKQLERKKKS
jgi:predicted RNA binding protein YcfA (HicA-like mRNA interferase family)